MYSLIVQTISLEQKDKCFLQLTTKNCLITEVSMMKRLSLWCPLSVLATVGWSVPYRHRVFLIYAQFCPN
jgi:hypothetical protein